MEKDFHYYLTLAAATLTKLPQPHIVAFASQFVDDNNEGQFTVGGCEVFFPEKLPANGGYYYPVMTQSLSPLSVDPFVQRYVYLPFHFLPGDNSIVINGKRNPLSTTPGSSRAQVLLDRALASNDPYRIGIAAHTFVDTWSHQNFTGLREPWNAVYPWYEVFKALVPNIGHAEAGHAPDIISAVWIDHRLGNAPVNNNGPLPPLSYRGPARIVFKKDRLSLAIDGQPGFIFEVLGQETSRLGAELNYAHYSVYGLAHFWGYAAAKSDADLVASLLKSVCSSDSPSPDCDSCEAGGPGWSGCFAQCGGNGDCSTSCGAGYHACCNCPGSCRCCLDKPGLP